MSETYKLVFRGEVLDGQHPAVVRRRLAADAGFADDALDKLFSGKPVVLKRAADTATAARLQAVFKKAGARLRVLPVEAAGATKPAATAASSAADPARSASAAPSGDGQDDLELLPAGSDILRATERTTFEPREVDTSALKLEGARFVAPDEDEPAAVQEPDVSHLSIAETGADMGPGSESSAAAVTAPDLDVAAAGSVLAPAHAPVAPAIDIDQVSFEVAPVGSELGQRKGLAPPAPPDTSHLSLQSQPDGGD